MVSHEMSVAAAFGSGALGAIALLVSIPVLVLLIEVLAALPKRNSERKPNSNRPSLAVLVPAHNESVSILPTLTDILAEIGPRDRLLVVADNCSDDTAEVARSAGAEVIERRDDENRGKGHALDYGIRHLSRAAPEVVIIVDADCRLENGAIDTLAERASATGRPIQALYLMHAPDESSVNEQVSEFTWRLKNWVRPLGLTNLGLPCQLVGTGMAFTWSTLNAANLATGALTEDLKLGLDLALKGHLPLFCPSAVVRSYFASSSQGRNTQQQRWEQGHRELIFSTVPRVLSSAFASRDLRLMAMALDLAVPPLFLLVLLLSAVFAITASGAVLGLSAVPSYISGSAVAALVLSIVIAWFGYGRDALPPRSLVSIVPYVYSKLHHYIRILGGSRATTWVRTDRS
ncbi:glycosyltransferase family 2 protein [Hyphomicrobium sp. 2TAF46]|uniref:glycosyltransferase family 2 protein n=1 Tax=Hyphomicrobium sp. 2TAF46 TaxID=3233019 RepID=UPI003F8F826B